MITSANSKHKLALVYSNIIAPSVEGDIAHIRPRSRAWHLLMLHIILRRHATSINLNSFSGAVEFCLLVVWPWSIQDESPYFFRVSCLEQKVCSLRYTIMWRQFLMLRPAHKDMQTAQQRFSALQLLQAGSQKYPNALVAIKNGLLWRPVAIFFTVRHRQICMTVVVCNQACQ